MSLFHKQRTHISPAFCYRHVQVKTRWTAVIVAAVASSSLGYRRFLSKNRPWYNLKLVTPRRSHFYGHEAVKAALKAALKTARREDGRVDQC